jgi:hypothetical protein
MYKIKQKSDRACCCWLGRIENRYLSPKRYPLRLPRDVLSPHDHTCAINKKTKNQIDRALFVRQNRKYTFIAKEIFAAPVAGKRASLGCVVFAYDFDTALVGAVVAVGLRFGGSDDIDLNVSSEAPTDGKAITLPFSAPFDRWRSWRRWPAATSMSSRAAGPPHGRVACLVLHERIMFFSASHPSSSSCCFKRLTN